MIDTQKLLETSATLRAKLDEIENAKKKCIVIDPMNLPKKPTTKAPIEAPKKRTEIIKKISRVHIVDEEAEIADRRSRVPEMQMPKKQTVEIEKSEIEIVDDITMTKITIKAKPKKYSKLNKMIKAAKM